MSGPLHIISSSYGNDSVALIQWAHEAGLQGVHVVYCDTGWSAPWWPTRVEKMSALAQTYGFQTHVAQSIGMAELVRMKKGWPGNAQQFCTAHLKGLPFLEWADEADPQRKAIVLIGKRRAESVKRRETPEFIENSEHHGGRKVWHPLCQHTDAERNALLARAGVEPLPHRSLECNPCVNANRAELSAAVAWRDRARECAGGRDCEADVPAATLRRARHSRRHSVGKARQLSAVHSRTNSCVPGPFWMRRMSTYQEQRP